MARIGTIGRIGAAQAASTRASQPAEDRTAVDAAPTSPARALVVLDGGRRDTPRAADRRTDSGFVAQLMICADPALRPSRLERTRNAAALYAETARRLA